MREFTVQQGEAGMTLLRYMEKVFAGQPGSIVYKSLRKKKVRVNGKQVTDGKHPLAGGDRIAMYISDELFPAERRGYSWKSLPPAVRVVYEDSRLLVLDKPSGLLCQAEEGESLEGRMRAYLLKKGEIPEEGSGVYLPSLCHRIDRNTEGLVLAAKDMVTQRFLAQKIRDKEIRKFYLCRLVRMPAETEGTVAGYIRKDTRHRRMVFTREQVPGGVYCETRYRIIADGSEPMAEVELLTGRTHQIRAMFAFLGCPLAGDVKYGAPRDGSRAYQQLCAYKLVFAFVGECDEFAEHNGRVFTVQRDVLIDRGGERFADRD